MRSNIHPFSTLVLLVIALSAFFAGPLRADWKETAGPDQLDLLEKSQSLAPDFYVSTEGNDSWSGTLAEPNAERTDGPFRTFEKAQAAVREYRNSGKSAGKPTVVEAMPGCYEFNTPLVFGPEDSGTPESPVVWRGSEKDRLSDGPGHGEPKVILSGGRALKNPVPVSNPDILKRIKPEVQDKIVQFDLKEADITDFGTPDGENNAELFLNNNPMTVARFPNEGFINIDRLDDEGTSPVDIRGTKGIKEGRFFVSADVSRWNDEPDGWTLGYWFWDWLFTRQKIESADSETGKIILKEPYHEYGFRKGQYFYVYNMLCELDAPGEFYIDSKAGILYFYPPENLEGASIFLTCQPTIAAAEGVANFVLRGFTLEGCRRTALSVNGKNCIVCDCVVKNVGKGAMNVVGEGGLVFGNHLYNLGAFGIRASAGDVKTLAHGNLAVVNNDIHDYARVERVYNAGISFDGCGNTVAHNRVTNAPHNAILFNGNDHAIELNELAFVCTESNDAGAVYTGYKWTSRGNVIRNNYLHDISGFQDKGCVGIYLDDQFSSADIVGNLFVNVTSAAFIGGGRDNRIRNNIFVDCKPSIHVDARGLDWQKDAAEGWASSAKNNGTLDGIEFKKPPFSEKYPELLNVLDNSPGAPVGNIIANNVIIQNAWNRRQPDNYNFWDIHELARPYLDIRNNIVGDYRMLLSLERIPSPGLPNPMIEFERIPTESIGLFGHPSATARPQ